jgi:hypothetical protein
VDGKVYSLTPEEAASRLMAAPTKMGTAPFFSLEVTAASAGSDYVQFTTADGKINCTVDIIPVEGGVSVAPTCGGAPAAAGDAVGGTTQKLKQAGLAEFVDAALERRPFNAAAAQGEALSAVVDGLPAMRQQALDTQRMVEDLEAGVAPDQVFDESQYGDGGYGGRGVDDSYYE